MIIYSFFNKINGKIYIGQTIRSLEKRVSEHLRKSKSRTTSFYRALEKYGIKNFEIEILKQCYSLEDLNNSEIEYISYFNSHNKNFGYNELLGGKNSKHSIITKEKISKALKGKSKEYLKEKLKAFWTIEKRKELSEIRKGKVSCSIDQLKKMSQAKTGITTEYNKKKRIPIICLNTGIKYESIAHACKELTLSTGNLTNVVKGKLPHTKGYRFEKIKL